MNVFFDVDYTLIAWNERLRPHVRAVFEQLRADGHTIYIWSGRGQRWNVIRYYHLDDLIAGCFVKPLYDHVARLPELGVTVQPDFVIDDHGEIVRVFGGYLIDAPADPPQEDDGMWRAYEAIRAFAAERAAPLAVVGGAD